MGSRRRGVCTQGRIEAHADEGRNIYDGSDYRKEWVRDKTVKSHGWAILDYSISKVSVLYCHDLYNVN